MIASSLRRASGALLAALLLVGSAARAEQPAAPTKAAAQVTLTDVELTNQAGERVRFKTDVLGERIVVMDFVFTTCTTICPVLSGIFARVQTQLGDKLGDGLKLVSMSLDPTRDTPARLSSYSQRYKAGKDWIWLTGDKDSVEQALKGLGSYAPNFNQHIPMVLVGDVKRGVWTRLTGFTSPEDIVSRVNELLAAREVRATDGVR